MDKRLRQLVDLVSKTGDRLVVYDSAEDVAPFVLMDLPSYQRLVSSSQQTARPPVDHEEAMAADMNLWQQTAQEVLHPKALTEVAPQADVESTPDPLSETATTSINQAEGEAQTGGNDKYYFEAVEEEADETSQG